MVGSRSLQLLMNTLQDTNCLQLLSTTQLLATSGPKWHLRNFLPEGGVTCIFGPPGAAKTSLAIDLGIALETHQPFLGMPTERRCAVLFINLEGKIRDRVSAALENRCVHSDTETQYLAWSVSSQIDICNDESREQLRSLFDRFRATVPSDMPIVVFLDNLAGAMQGADENTIVAMNKALSTLRFICPEATVVVIHHSGHDSNRPRGHSALIAAADALIRVGKQRDARFVQIEKLRDASDSASRIFFSLVPGKMADANSPVSACVVEHRPEMREETATGSNGKELLRLSGDAKMTLQVIKDLCQGKPIAEATAKKAVMSHALSASNKPLTENSAAKKYSRGRDALIEKGLLTRDPVKQTVCSVG